MPKYRTELLTGGSGYNSLAQHAAEGGVLGKVELIWGGPWGS
jgi:hypothetical protein